MPIPTIKNLMLPTIRVMSRLGGSATVREMTVEVAAVVELTEEEQSETTPGGQLRFYNRLGWARNHLNGSLITNSANGVWTLTREGENVSCMSDGEAKPIVHEIFRGRRPQTDVGDAPDAAEEEAPDANGEDDWKQHLIKTLMQMDPHAFERLCQRLLRESGFESVEVTKKSGDGGIDGVGILHVNLLAFRVVFQCKRYSGSVGAPDIQKFRGAIEPGEKNLFITTGVFTSAARKEAVRPGVITIDLIDGERLCDLLKNLELGVSTEMVERVNIDRDWFLSL